MWPFWSDGFSFPVYFFWIHASFPWFPLLPVNFLFSKKPHTAFFADWLFKNEDIPWKQTSRLKWQNWVWLSERDLFNDADWNGFPLLLCLGQVGRGEGLGSLPRLLPHPRDGQQVPSGQRSGHGQASACTLLLRRLPSLDSPKTPPKQLVFTHMVGTVTIITTTFSGNVTPFYLTAWANLYSEK